MGTLKPDFKTWYANKLKVARHPLMHELTGQKAIYQDVQVIISVADEFYLEMSRQLNATAPKPWLWFPMNDGGKMGLESLFGALHTLHECWQSDLTVLLHCREGINRSHLVKAAFYYMVTDKHLVEEKQGKIVTIYNQLLYFCEKKYLPELSIMEKWLRLCYEAFEHKESFIGGMLQWAYKEAGINKTLD